MKYQKDQADQSTHTYFYDKINRLEEVFISTDKVHQSRQAHYLYYDYGPLSRVEIGEQKVQGMDYAYTINGWMKAMNGTILNPGYELGRDNASGYLSQNTSVHNKFGKDVVGYTLGYFNGDYQSIGSTNFAPSPYTEPILNTAITPMYNGNIAFTTTAIGDVPSPLNPMKIQMGVYRYDQMNRLVSARTFRASGLAASNSWTGAAETQEYKSTYTYDKNGNLTHLTRNGAGTLGLNMDDISYTTFEQVPNTSPLSGTHASNRLDYVDDISSSYTQDIDDQAPNNYGYDRLGQLTNDVSEGMTIEWFSGNRKVKKITRSDKTIEFTYNPFGQRILKKVTITATSAVTRSYYAYDANGQVMGVYDVNLTTNNATLNELNIYGASRLGMIDRDVTVCTAGTAATPPVYPSVNPTIHTLGYKKYEITNYLGNVNAVINDRKLFVSSTYEAVVIMNSDYYPFGMEMPDRHMNEDKYRFGYNGMEMDNEAKGNGNSYTTEFRQYDPRLGRWLSLDPMAGEAPDWSPYRAFFDNPIVYTDPSGLFETRKEARAERRAAIKEGATVGYTKFDKKSGEYYFKRTDGDPKDFSFTRNIWSAKKTAYKGGVEFVDAAEARGAIPYGNSDVFEAFNVGSYRMLPNYVNGQLSHYTASIIVPDPQNPSQEVARLDYIVARDKLGDFEKNVETYTFAAALSFGYGSKLHLDQWQIDYANGDHVDGLLGYLKDQWTDPVNIIFAAGGTVMHLSAPKGVYNNVQRFSKKVPANAKNSIKLSRNGLGQYKIEAISPGKVPGSKAVYTKIVDNKGNTLNMVKTTYDPSGKVVHTKNKM